MPVAVRKPFVRRRRFTKPWNVMERLYLGLFKSELNIYVLSV